MTSAQDSAPRWTSDAAWGRSRVAKRGRHPSVEERRSRQVEHDVYADTTSWYETMHRATTQTSLASGASDRWPTGKGQSSPPRVQVGWQGQTPGSTGCTPPRTAGPVSIPFLWNLLPAALQLLHYPGQCGACHLTHRQPALLEGAPLAHLIADSATPLSAPVPVHVPGSGPVSLTLLYHSGESREVGIG